MPRRYDAIFESQLDREGQVELRALLIAVDERPREMRELLAELLVLRKEKETLKQWIRKAWAWLQ